MVDLKPTSFTEDDGLLDSSLEEVYLTYHRRLKETSKADRDKPLMVSCRQVVRGVNHTLQYLAQQHSTSVSEFSLNVSFKVLAELRAVGVIGVVGQSYSSLLLEGVRDALFEQLSALTSDYNVSRRDGNLQRHFPVYPQVYTALFDVADGCGTSLPKLYQVGLLMALTKSESAVPGGILSKAVDEVFKPEIHDFLRYMARWRKKLDDGIRW